MSFLSDDEQGDHLILIQKLVDGELSHAERSQWLSGLESDSDSWREMALAFVEKQLFDESLGRSNDHEVVSPPETFALSAKNRRANGLNAIVWIATLASCLLIGFVVGQELSQTNQEPSGFDVAARPDFVSESDESEAALGLAEALSRSIAPVPNDFRRALMKAGYSLKDTQEIANVSLPSGGRIEVPVRSVDVTYVGLKTFQ